MGDPEKARIYYDEWKKIAWRYLRVFIAASLVSMAANIEKIGKWEDMISLLLVPAITAGVVATAKALREWLAPGDYSNTIHKMPL